eukprot:CAMPEP_0204029730 /NCGR_PEP_ID=MMETSP0360-20130528/57765_1 /ASSEMBLY_ACC=CAM_ASM_000342 /TAXON_ID=268821 /ORGANISM="Scrippsiella Hangoei, Strain SHTV-5" /LENGTH=33 /DNA_ID= /DNA_START= /DNA_END= /DNA_ORIENTATION=
MAWGHVRVRAGDEPSGGRSAEERAEPLEPKWLE